MASAELEIQGAMNTRLRADVPLTALINKRVYDQPPTPVTYPYVTIGEAQTIRDDATCLRAEQVFMTLHAWSQAVGYLEVKRIADAVEESLHLAPLDLPTNRLVSIVHQRTRIFRDADGLTSHAVIELVANTEKPLA